MAIFKRYEIKAFERGLLFRKDEFQGVLGPGKHRGLYLRGKVRLDVVDTRAPWIEHERLKDMTKSHRLGDEITVIDVRDFERALVWIDGRLDEVLDGGLYALFNTYADVRVDMLDTRLGWLDHADLDVIIKSGLLADELEVIDLSDRQRALVWIDGRLDKVLGPGQAALFKTFCEVAVERIEVGKVRFEHAELPRVLTMDAGYHLAEQTVAEGMLGLVYQDGELAETLGPGRYAFWKGVEQVRVFHVDTREMVLDVAGQEIMTADKVSLRMNALVTYKVADAKAAVSAVDDHTQALYREAQLALRAVIGTAELDALLAEKDAVADALREQLVERAAEFGVEVRGFGLRDVILPGDMKDLLNKVTEAKKAAEAALITRREETAAMRSQANTAKLLEGSPVLMRLRELEVLEKIAEKADLKVILGEKGLADRVINLL